MNTNKDTISLYLKSFVPNMSKESIETYRALTTKKNISKGEILLEPDVLTYKCYIIESGFAGSFLRQEDGSHFIRTIFKELTSFGSPQCLFSNTKNTTEYRTLTDCVVYELDYMKFKKINNPEFLQFQINTLKKVYYINSLS